MHFFIFQKKDRFDKKKVLWYNYYNERGTIPSSLRKDL